MAVQQQQVYTSEDFERYIARPENADRLFELINGEIIEKMPTQLHAYIIQMISGFLFVFLRQNPLGHALIEARYALPGDDQNGHVPDLSFITNEKGALVSKGAAPYMPDLAVEVQSPGQSDKLMADKADYYLAHGTRMVWVIYPSQRIVEVLTPTDRKLLVVSDTLDGGDVLPGFTMPVRDIFPVEDASS